VERVLLFSLINPNIKVTIEAYFDEKGDLVIDGYDIGKTVNDYWGDSDYEYVTTVSGEDLAKLYEVMGIQAGSKSGLLLEIQKRFNTNSCYSDFNGFIAKHGIHSGGFSWT
jgi:hypothetical protein